MPDTIGISILVTIIISILICVLYKPLGKAAGKEPLGCGCGMLILFYVVLFVVCSIDRAITPPTPSVPPKTTVTVHLVSGGTKEVERSSFVGDDTTFINSQNVYLNNTKRDLVIYMVKYTRNGTSNNESVSGQLIKPNQYFYWYPEMDGVRMFQKPPSSTTIVTHHNRKIDFTYITFLDYADEVSDYVEIVGY